MGGDLLDSEREKILTVSLGLFSVVRIERPTQILVTGTEYNVPEKQCNEPINDDPCSIFNGIPFPEKEFNSSVCRPQNKNNKCGCGI